MALKEGIAMGEQTEGQITVHLNQSMFTSKETILMENEQLQATIFRFRSGVCGLRISNDFGEIVILPFQGQQIWSAQFEGRELGIISVFDEPRATRDYLENYGGFLLHCGFTSMGCPGPLDTHPLHEELPNAPYQEAYVRAGRDKRGPYLEVSGTYRHSIAFTWTI